MNELLKLEVNSAFGSFIIEANKDLSTLFYNSPLSGVYKYFYHIEEERFISNKNGHLFDENISR